MSDLRRGRLLGNRALKDQTNECRQKKIFKSSFPHGASFLNNCHGEICFGGGDTAAAPRRPKLYYPEETKNYN
jgi:hypothetical protein